MSVGGFAKWFVWTNRYLKVKATNHFKENLFKNKFLTLIFFSLVAQLIYTEHILPCNEQGTYPTVLYKFPALIILQT